MVRHQKQKNSRQHGGRPSKPFKSQAKDSDEDEDDDEIECWYCCKKGHLEKDCRLKKQADKKRRRREKQEAKACLAAATKAPNTAKEALISDAEIW